MYPIIQAAMNWVSAADLVAAVSNAGGLRTLGPNAGSKDITLDVELTGERMRTQIRKIKKTHPSALCCEYRGRLWRGPHLLKKSGRRRNRGANPGSHCIRRKTGNIYSGT